MEVMPYQQAVPAEGLEVGEHTLHLQETEQQGRETMVEPWLILHQTTVMEEAGEQALLEETVLEQREEREEQGYLLQYRDLLYFIQEEAVGLLAQVEHQGLVEVVWVDLGQQVETLLVQEQIIVAAAVVVVEQAQALQEEQMVALE